MISLSIYIQFPYHFIKMIGKLYDFTSILHDFYIDFTSILDVRSFKYRTSKIVQPLLVGIRLPPPYSPSPKGRGP